MLGFDEILVPVDGSDSAVRAAEYAAALAGATRVPLRLLHVFTNSPYANVGLARMSAEEIRAAQHSAARDVFQRARAAIGPEREVVETVLMGDPAQEILGYLTQQPRALVVMGRRGLSPMQSLLVGSVSDKVVRHANGAVLLVN